MELGAAGLHQYRMGPLLHPSSVKLIGFGRLMFPGAVSVGDNRGRNSRYRRRPLSEATAADRRSTVAAVEGARVFVVTGQKPARQ